MENEIFYTWLIILGGFLFHIPWTIEKLDKKKDIRLMVRHMSRRPW